MISEARPKIVCLCGSTKFREEFETANFLETIRGHIVLSVGCYMHADSVKISPKDKRELVQLHFRKIELADEIFVISRDRYVGLSTCDEIGYAMALGKPVRWFEDENRTPPRRATSL